MLAGRTPPGKRDMALSPPRRLPAQVLDRPKTGFSVPIHEWLDGDATRHGGWGFRQWAKHIHAAQWEAAG
jgi:asparagine synthase (glutamine-hydrolysing)